MTTTIDLLPTANMHVTPSGHVSLKQPGAHRGLLDGAWWPRSRGLAHELPALIGLLDHRWGRITHVTVKPTYWPLNPWQVRATGHVVHMGRFGREQDPRIRSLLTCTVDRWNPVIIPPGSGPSAAARPMAAAADPHHHGTAAALIANEDALGLGCPDDAGESHGVTAPHLGGVPAAPIGLPARAQ